MIDPREDIANLQSLYIDTLNEPIPEDMKQLLDQLDKAPPEAAEGGGSAGSSGA